MNLIILIIGIGLLGLGIITLRKSIRLSKVGVSVVSKVVRVEQRAGTDEDGYKTLSFVPILEYSDQDKQTYSMQGESSKNKHAYKEGDTIKITYDPDNPKNASVKSFSTMWLTPGLILIVGLLLVVGAFFA